MDTDEVAKIRVIVVRDGESWLLMSRKNAGGVPQFHDKLEMLGGHLAHGETPVQSLLRELAEEEASGQLARVAALRKLSCESRVADGALHHLFELRIDPVLANKLRHDSTESLGFEWVRAVQLDSGELDERLTPRTREILQVFGPVPAPKGSA